MPRRRPPAPIEAGSRHVVSTFHPSAVATPNTRFTHEALLRQPSLHADAAALVRFLERDSMAFSPRFYEAEFMGLAGDGARLFRPTLRLRLSAIDRSETADDGSAPGLEAAIAFIRGDAEAFGSPSPVVGIR